MDFKSKAFLGEDIKEYQKINEKENLYLDLSKRINIMLNENIELMTGQINTHKDIMIVALTLKSLQTFNSIIILSVHGLEADSKALLRVLAEGIIQLGAIIKDEDYYDEFLKKADFQTLMIANNLRKDEHKGILRHDTIAAVQDMDFTALEKLVQTISKDSLSLYKVSQRAGMLEIYIYIYGELSKYVHSNASIRDEYVDFENGLLKGFSNIPREEDQQYVLLTSNYLLLKLIDFYNDYFDGRLDNMIRELWEENKILFGES